MPCPGNGKAARKRLLSRYGCVRSVEREHFCKLAVGFSLDPLDDAALYVFAKTGGVANSLLNPHVKRRPHHHHKLRVWNSHDDIGGIYLPAISCQRLAVAHHLSPFGSTGTCVSRVGAGLSS